MGTRSTIKFYDNWGSDEPLVSIYQQFDGYIDGVGHDLANFLKDKTVINGIGMDQRMENGFANGMGCLAAQFIAEKKTEIGGFYISNLNDQQEYNYEVRLVDDKFNIKVEFYDSKFEGTPEELLEYKEPDEDEE